MLANAAQAEARIDFGRTDKVFNVLPVFHSFGLTVGLILPLVSGVRRLSLSLAAALPHRPRADLRRERDDPVRHRHLPRRLCALGAPYDFRSLRYILAGAEPVKEATRRTYMEKFGLRILEGYGVTETAPALALNTPMFNKFGTVGRLLPAWRHGSSRCRASRTAAASLCAAPTSCWATCAPRTPACSSGRRTAGTTPATSSRIDDEGFITIKGRAKRFAKIGGEMVSLAAVEALAAELWPDALSGVAAVPDPRKGERLVLVTTKIDPSRSDFLAFANSRGASDMMVPAEVIMVDKLPLLGSGKIDNIALSQLARERAMSRRRH